MFSGIKQKTKMLILCIYVIYSPIIDKILLYAEITVYAGRVPTTELVNRIFTFCELYSGKTMYPYQEQFSKRVIRSILEDQ